MKRIGRKSLIVLLILLLIGGGYLFLFPRTGGPESRIRAKLYVNNNPMNDDNIVIYQLGSTFYCDLPMLTVLEGLGSHICIQDDGTDVAIETEDEKFLLRNYKLYRDNGNYLCDVPGYDISLFDRKGRPVEVYVEHQDLLQVLNEMGFSNLKISMNPEDKNVFVEQSW